MVERVEKNQGQTTDRKGSRPAGSRGLRLSYAKLGLQPGARMRDIESAYWKVAKELKGQPALTPYTEAYEALVNSVKPRVSEAPPEPLPPEEAPKELPPESSSPGSKFGWPAT